MEQLMALSSILKHRYLFLFGFALSALFPSIIGLEMLLFCCLSAKEIVFVIYLV
jgi:hypothetical protein